MFKETMLMLDKKVFKKIFRKNPKWLVTGCINLCLNSACICR